MSRPRAWLDQLNVVVPDVRAAVDFYRRLGLELPDTLPEWQSHHRTLASAGELEAELDSAAFAARWDAGWPTGRAGVVLGFRVATREEVDALYAELTGAGHVGRQPPYDAFWGARYAVVEDPGGNAVGLMSPIDPAQSREVPPPPSDETA